MSGGGRGARAALAVAAICAGVAASACGEEDPDTPAVPPGLFGINAQLLQPLSAAGRIEEIGLHLDAIAALGLDFVRTNLDWGIIQPLAPTDPEWTSTDAWVRAVAERGLRWQPTVMGTPTPNWAADPEALAAGCAEASPGRPATYAALLRALVRRYGREGEFWAENPDVPYEPVVVYELWNEPNHYWFWCPRPDPEAWAGVALAGARAVHRVDPQARVVSAGLAPFQSNEGEPPQSLAPDEFLARALSAEPELARQIDVVGVHPYGGTAEEVISTLAWFRGIVDATSLRGKPLSVNEVGWATQGGSGYVSAEEDRAGFASAIVPAIARSSCRIEAIALHTWITAELDPANAEHWYGVAGPASAEPYATALAYATRAAELTGSEPPDGGEEVVAEAAAPELGDACSG